jgi:hypothetical protein
VRFGWIQAQALCFHPMKRSLVILLGSMLAASAAFATTYVRVEKDGSKTYSDRPLPGGQPVDIEPAQTYSSPPPSPLGSSSGNLPREQQLLREMDNFRYASCTLTPKNDETFTNPESVGVSLLLSPPLRAGDVVQLLVDGVPQAGQSIFSFAIPQPFRGSHAVTASVKDRYGKTLCTASSTFHVFRPSINSPARR